MFSEPFWEVRGRGAVVDSRRFPSWSLLAGTSGHLVIQLAVVSIET